MAIMVFRVVVFSATDVCSCSNQTKMVFVWCKSTYVLSASLKVNAVLNIITILQCNVKQT